MLIKHQKRPFAERSRSELSASIPLSEQFNLNCPALGMPYFVCKNGFQLIAETEGSLSRDEEIGYVSWPIT